MMSTSNYLDGSPGEQLRIVRSAERNHVEAGWYDSYQSFSGAMTAEDAHFGLLVVHNDSVIAPASGFPVHEHREMEIVTWIFTGEMHHLDSEGNSTTIYPGLSQRMSAGTGIRHTERNPSSSVPSHGVQMWLLPDESVTPSYDQADVTDSLATGELIPVASGHNRDAAISLHQHQATLWAANLPAGAQVVLPEAPFAHLFVGVGSVDLEGVGPLATGDVARVVNAQARLVTGGDDGAEILLWQMG